MRRKKKNDNLPRTGKNIYQTGQIMCTMVIHTFSGGENVWITGMPSPAAACLPLMREVAKIFDFCRRERQNKQSFLSPSLLLRKIQPPLQRGPLLAPSGGAFIRKKSCRGDHWSSADGQCPPLHAHRGYALSAFAALRHLSQRERQGRTTTCHSYEIGDCHASVRTGTQ